MRPYLLTTCLVIMMVSPGVAQDNDSVGELSAGPTAVLLTEAERAELASLSEPEAAGRFLELFWLRRDPDLGSRENELRYEIETRILAADNEFGEDGVRGSLTARGKLLILLGAPARYSRMPIADYLAQLYKTPPPEIIASQPEASATMHGVTFNRAKGTADLWAYGRDNLPPGVELLEGEEEVVFAFFDIFGIGRYQLQGGIRRAQTAEKVLTAAPAALLLHPELDEAPVYSLLPGVRAATAEQLAVLDAEAPAWPDGAAVSALQGASSADDLPLWLLVVLPADLPPADTVVGRILLEGGDVVGSFQQATGPRAVARGNAYTLALPAPEGPSMLDIALLAGGEAVAVRQVDLEMSETGSTFLSAVFAGAEVEEAKDASAGDPFVFGGYRLTPRPSGSYIAEENLAVFCLVVRPGVNVDGSTDATVRMRWYVNGKAAPSAAPQSVSLAPVGSEVYVWGTQLPLSALAAGNDYTLRVKVADKLSGSSRTTEIPIRITD